MTITPAEAQTHLRQHVSTGWLDLGITQAEAREQVIDAAETARATIAAGESDGGTIEQETWAALTRRLADDR